jgi:imidazole glycerol-phosphate synthase subunit HisH
MIAIVDYGMGNISSILNMFKRIEVRDIVLTKNKEDIERADKIILPGVGAFDHGMASLKSTGLLDILNKKALKEKVPVLGICLGMQLLTNKSEEGNEKGLEWINADTVKFILKPDSANKIPHMGWNYVKIKKPSPLFNSKEPQKFYFVHSYYVKCNEQNDVIATCEHETEFTCALQHDNIFGVQFHPEKSHKYGMSLLQNFYKL